MLLFLQKKIKLPKVNRDLADTIHNEEGGEEEKKSVEEAVKKVSTKKKKPGLSGEDFSCGRFDNMFHNPVITTILSRLLSVSFLFLIS